ncbi:hypothetical protein BLA6993_04435 [Burkholderia lata]|nr:hypothetical protein BLA6993_04435 [Burkholderia lata]
MSEFREIAQRLAQATRYFEKLSLFNNTAPLA